MPKLSLESSHIQWLNHSVWAINMTKDNKAYAMKNVFKL